MDKIFYIFCLIISFIFGYIIVFVYGVIKQLLDEDKLSYKNGYKLVKAKGAEISMYMLFSIFGTFISSMIVMGIILIIGDFVFGVKLNYDGRMKVWLYGYIVIYIISFIYFFVKIVVKK